MTDNATNANQLVLATNGGVGIGTATPTAGIKLEVNGITRLTPGGSGGYMQFGNPNSETGLSWLRLATLADTRADIRFDGDRLLLAAGEGAGVPANSGLVIDTMGRVGIGTVSPTFGKLHVDGGTGNGVYGRGDQHGLDGKGDIAGVYGLGGTYGAYGNGNDFGVYGVSTGSTGVKGFGGTFGVEGEGTTGVYGQTSTESGVGVFGKGSVNGSSGVIGESHGASSYAVSGIAYDAGWAGYFSGKVQVDGTLTATGNVCAANISCASDARLKQNVTNLKYGLDQLLRLRPVSWRWKSEPEGKPQMGLVAQEVEKVLPELVLREADATKPLGLNYMALLPVAVKAIQEQQAQILEQQKHIKRLEAQLNQVKRALKRKRVARR